MTDKILIDRSVVEQAISTIVELEYSNSTAVSDKMARDSKAALSAALEQPDIEIPASVPEGWKLVPVKPIHEWAENLADRGMRIGSLASAISDMLDAAPQPPVVEQPQVEQEPVAFAIFTESGNARMWSTFQLHVQKLADAEGLTVTPLYTHPQPPRQPLTEEQILNFGPGQPYAVWSYEDQLYFARAIERAHGIGGEK